MRSPRDALSSVGVTTIEMPRIIQVLLRRKGQM
jgi:hypothetical protein